MIDTHYWLDLDPTYDEEVDEDGTAYIDQTNEVNENDN